MAWTVTITDKVQTVDGLSVTLTFANNSTTFTKTFTTTEAGDTNWLKNQAKATLANVKALNTLGANYNINDTITGIGN